MLRLTKLLWNHQCNNDQCEHLTGQEGRSAEELLSSTPGLCTIWLFTQSLCALQGTHIASRLAGLL
jgi:hypothetical protein